MGPRAGISSVLIAGAIVLLIAIAIGNRMGNRVLGQVSGHMRRSEPTPVIPQIGVKSDPATEVNWKHTQVMSVATDPGFPDPRITPPPPPPPRTPEPYTAPPLVVRHTPRPEPAPSREPYTSPPLPIPLVSHTPPNEVITPVPSDTPFTAP